MNQINDLNNDIILISDDNFIINQANKNLLNEYFIENKLNYDIILCYDGYEILQNIFNIKNRNRIKYILTDENMQYLNGSYVIKIIRYLEIKKFINHIKITSLTAEENFLTTKFLIDIGCDLILSKPLSKN